MNTEYHSGKAKTRIIKITKDHCNEVDERILKMSMNRHVIILLINLRGGS